MKFNTFENLNKVLEDIEHLKESYDLLGDLYREIGGPYSQHISDELRRKLNNYFDFDDSE